MASKDEIRFIVVKDYYRDNQPFMDNYPILYSTEVEANTVKANLENGSDPSWFGPETGEESAFLYVDCITL